MARVGEITLLHTRLFFPLGDKDEWPRSWIVCQARDEDTVKIHWEIVCQAKNEVTGKFSAELFAKQRRTGNRKIQQ